MLPPVKLGIKGSYLQDTMFRQIHKEKKRMHVYLGVHI